MPCVWCVALGLRKPCMGGAKGTVTPRICIACRPVDTRPLREPAASPTTTYRQRADPHRGCSGGAGQIAVRATSLSRLRRRQLAAVSVDATRTWYGALRSCLPATASTATCSVTSWIRVPRTGREAPVRRSRLRRVIPRHRSGERRAPAGPPRNSLWVYTGDCDAVIERLPSSREPITEEPADQPWGERVARVLDPDGNEVMVGQRAAPAVRRGESQRRRREQ